MRLIVNNEQYSPTISIDEAITQWREIYTVVQVYRDPQNHPHITFASKSSDLPDHCAFRRLDGTVNTCTPGTLRDLLVRIRRDRLYTKSDFFVVYSEKEAIEVAYKVSQGQA